MIKLKWAQLAGVYATSRRGTRELRRNDLREVGRDGDPASVSAE